MPSSNDFNFHFPDAIMSKIWVLVGSLSPFISTLQFTTSPPSLSFVSQVEAGRSPSWLANLDKFPTTIYATEEIGTGFINSLELDLNTGGLTRLANTATKGGAPTHLGFITDFGIDSVTLGAANIVNCSAFFVNLNTTTGQFTSDTDLVRFEGSGPLPNQLTPHAHQVRIVF